MVLDHSKVNLISYQHVADFWVVNFPSAEYEELTRFCTLAYELHDTKNRVVFPLNTREEYDNFMAMVGALGVEILHHHG